MICLHGKYFSIQKYKKKGGNLIWSYDPKERNKVMKGQNDFWKSVMSGWFDIQDSPSADMCSEDILKQPLWYNSNILIEGKSLFKMEWYNSGVWHVNDLLNEKVVFTLFRNLKIYMISILIS